MPALRETAVTARDRDRDGAQERRAARDAEQRRQVARARLDDRLRAREQALIERWHADRDREDEDE